MLPSLESWSVDEGVCYLVQWGVSWLWGGKSVGVDGEEVPGVDGAVLVVVEGMEGGLDQSMTLRVVHACKRQQRGVSCVSSVGGLLLFIVGKRRK